MMGFVPRSVKQKVLSVEQAEGVGARVRRSIGRQELRNFDPFLMLDEFKVGRPGGFPDHPHRGFETVTYVLPSSKGSVQHEDFCGRKGTIGPGDLQWMTAGRGILHAEMPVNEVPVHGLQLWINLHAKDKMIEPAYQELLHENIPKVTKDGVTAIVIAGEALGIESKIYTRTPTHYIHYTMQPNSVLEHKIPEGWATFAYTIAGKAKFGGSGNFIEAHNTVTFNLEGDGIKVETGEEEADFVLISGKPIGEPVVQHGPFVMNTQKEILKTIDDYQSGKNGFEKADKWESEIQKGI
jgi:redox-sensitive bicupin YhaK (pirin superfamily)